VRIVEADELLSAPFLTLATATDGEKGLKAMAFDPDYASNGFVYVYYTDATTLKNKVSRFTRMTGDSDRADPATERVLIDGIDSGIFHSGGALEFGPDGRLYISTGDASYGPNAQALGNLNGKILRLNRDGSVPADNPFRGTSGARPEIWAYGLRNPFTFAFSDAGSLYINDVGQDTWEELNLGARGANYGWPTCEGACDDARFVDPIYAYSHSDGPGRSITGAVFYDGAMFPAAYAGDYFFGDYVGSYIKRYDVATGTVSGFATGAPYPVDLDVGPDGALYYLSVETKTIHRIAYGESASEPPAQAGDNLLRNGGFEATGTGWLAPWRLQVRDPAQATVTRDTSQRDAGDASARVSIGSASLDWHVQLLQPGVPISAGRAHTLTFSAKASTARTIRVALHRNSSPYPTYHERSFDLTGVWQRFSLNFTPGVDDAQALLALNLGVATGSIWLDAFSLTASSTVGRPPEPSIGTPADGTRFRAGDVISFSGSATDPEDGTLGAARLRWEVLFHHDTHTHPFIEPFSGKSSGSFTVPDTGETSANVWYRIHLTATDSDGNTATVIRDIRPRTATVTLATAPAGLRLALDGTAVDAPHVFTGVVGFKREISAPETQTAGGRTYRFKSWSDGGARTHTIATPSSAATITAIYEEVVANTLANGGFDASGSGWRDPWLFVLRSPASAAFVRDTTDRTTGPAALRVDVLRADRAKSVQVVQPDVRLVAGVRHTLSFDARAASARSIGVLFTKRLSPYAVFVRQSVSIGTGWRRYTVTFTPSKTRPQARLTFNLGKNKGAIWIDAVTLTR
jgi:glucose/arabinose dehydrogenase